MSDIMRPIVNNNGTSAKSLIDDRIKCRTLVLDLMDKLRDTCPHGRDYLGNHELYSAARDVHSQRFAVLFKLEQDLLAEALDILGQSEGRRAA
jgi:hypothetical protein